MITKLLFLPERAMTGFSADGRTVGRTVSEYEFVLFLHDGGRAFIGDCEYAIMGGDIRIHKPGDYVYSYRYSDAYVLHLAPDFPARPVIDALPSFIRANDTDAVRELYDAMLRLYVRPSPARELKLTSLVYEFLYTLATAADRHERSQHNSLAVIQSVTAAKAFIRTHYGEKVQLRTVADAVHLHPNYLHRVFRQASGMSPREYLTNIRIAEAKRLLLSSDLPQSAIAARCGFETDAYFVAVFRRTVGTTPGRFRCRQYTDIT